MGNRAQKWYPKSANFEKKNEDFSESLNSFRAGSIIRPSSGHKISRNAFVVAIAFPEKISAVRKDFFMTPENRYFHEKSTFS